MARDLIDFFSSDVFDSREVEERIKELERDIEAGIAESEEKQELETLKAFRDEVGSSEWSYGITFIRDSYFEDYAQELAEEIGAINPNASWPANCIAWEQAARELRMAYSSAELDGVTFWYRA